MDYDTFISKFPSQKILDMFLSKAEFLTLFKKTFDKEGPLAVCMSDVEIARLSESGAITAGKRGKLVLNTERFDVEPYYQRFVAVEVRQLVLGPLAITARYLRAEPAPLSPIVIGDDGVLSYAGRTFPNEEENDQGEVLISAVVQDMRNVVENEPFEWGQLGTLAVVEGVLTFTLKSEKSSQSEPPKSRKRAKVLTQRGTISSVE